jgi:hypothetical protein
MPGSGVIFKRCGCRNSEGRRLEKSCPGSASVGMGRGTSTAPRPTCSAARNVYGGAATRRWRRRGQARDQWLAATVAQRTGTGWTVESSLRHWLDQHT